MILLGTAWNLPPCVIAVLLLPRILLILSLRYETNKTHSRSWALLEKPPIVHLLKNFPALYGIQTFITAFTRALHWSLSWARSIQSVRPHPVPLRSIIILSTHLRLGLPSGLFPSGFPTNILYAFLFSSRDGRQQVDSRWLSGTTELKKRIQEQDNQLWIPVILISSQKAGGGGGSCMLLLIRRTKNHFFSRIGSVSKVTSKGQMAKVQLPSWTSVFASPLRKDQIWASVRTVTSGYQRTRVKWRKREATYHFHQILRLMRGALLLSPSIFTTATAFRSRDSAVGIAAGYGLDSRGVGVWVRVQTRFFFSPRRSDRFWVPPSLLSNGYLGLFPRR
jgi:hypothetical protein